MKNERLSFGKRSFIKINIRSYFFIKARKFSCYNFAALFGHLRILQNDELKVLHVVSNFIEYATWARKKTVCRHFKNSYSTFYITLLR